MRKAQPAGEALRYTTSLQVPMHSGTREQQAGLRAGDALAIHLNSNLKPAKIAPSRALEIQQTETTPGGVVISQHSGLSDLSSLTVAGAALAFHQFPVSLVTDSCYGTLREHLLL